MDKYLIGDFSNTENSDSGSRKFFADPDNRPYAREPVLARMPDGKLVCTFLSGGVTEPHNKNVVLYKKSYDNGKTWSDTQVIFEHSALGLWATEIFTEGDTPFMVVTMYNALCPFKAMQSFISYTYDNGETWEYPTAADPSMFNSSIRQGVRLSNGDIIFPTYFLLPEHNFYFNIEDRYNDKKWWSGIDSGVAVAISSDNGKTYAQYGRVTKKGCHLWEPCVVEAEPGHVIMFVRENNTGFLGRADSYDYGKTWSEYVVTSMPNPSSKITALNVKGKILLISNFNSTERKNLEIWESSDNGKTFAKLMELEDKDKFFCYPHAIHDKENNCVLIAYENYTQHYLATIDYNELGI